MRMSLLFGVKTVVDSNRGRLETCRGKSAMPLLEADKGMALFPQPQLLQGYANADLQKLNAARWFCFNPRRPARRQANPPYLLPAYTLHSRARRSLENVSDPNRDPNADRSGKHRTDSARCFPYLGVFFYPIPVCADMNPPIFLAASACMSLVAWQYVFSVKPAE